MRVLGPTKPKASLNRHRNLGESHVSETTPPSDELFCTLKVSPCGCHVMSLAVRLFFCASPTRISTIASICASENPAVRGSFISSARTAARTWLSLSCAPTVDGSAKATIKSITRRIAERECVIERTIQTYYSIRKPLLLIKDRNNIHDE